ESAEVETTVLILAHRLADYLPEASDPRGQAIRRRARATPLTSRFPAWRPIDRYSELLRAVQSQSI
ncbi:MAG: hypothetical protein VX747_10635, partial [Actinomycetota bacterium]|nr:hypothetical protein [Actinomycetota bacterium]